MKNIRKKLRRYIDECGILTMIEFLESYVGIDSQFEALSKATHKDIKFFNFDRIVSVPFGCIDIEKIETGRILLVSDCYHHIAAYKNPLRIKDDSKIKVMRR